MNQTYSIDEFLTATRQDVSAREFFQLENSYTLEVNLSGRFKAKAGSMIGYTGQVNFKREGMMEGGFRRALKKAVSGEGQKLMHVEGQGRVYLADSGKRIQLLRLQGEEIVVNGNDLLALEDGLDYDITMLKRIASMASGGLFNVRISGSGLVAMTSHYTPITLLVEEGCPVYTDPNATVAWSGSLEPSIKTDLTVGAFFGRGSGEVFQLAFEGKGWIVLQPYEEVYFAQSKS